MIVLPQGIILGPLDCELLRDLAIAGRWLRPMDLGGHDASRHSPALAKLCRHGFVKRRPRNTLTNARGTRRGSYEYRITRRGRGVIGEGAK